MRDKPVLFVCEKEGCTLTYRHRHLTSMELLDHEDKICGCGQTSCIARKKGKP